MARLPQATLGLAWVLAAMGTAQAQTATETVLHSFDPNPAMGANPYAGVVRDPAGNLYGTAYLGGTAHLGVVYKLDTAGHETVLHSFAGGADGANPQAGVILDSAGNLYGTASRGGGPYNEGVVFKLDSSGNETVLYAFSGQADGGGPFGGVVRDPAGNLYGTAVGGGTADWGVVFKLDTEGNLSVLHDFLAEADGAEPYAGLIRDPAGNLFGTSRGGLGHGGVIYKVDTAGQFTVLHSFTGGADGQFLSGGLFRDSAGNLYGTTLYGGKMDAGVVYKLDTNGHETVLYSFSGGADGGYPLASVVLDSGVLYGTTSGGGTATGRGGPGVVYKIDTAGRETVLYSFSGAADGDEPEAGVVLDAAGNLYGTTHLGGSAKGDNGLGVVFKLSASGEETAYRFPAPADGGNPNAGVARDQTGNLYGTTVDGGAANVGVIYKVDTTGRETVLYNFTGGADGAFPYSTLMLDAAGNLYGTASSGGEAGWGTVFELSPEGQLTVLWSFTGGADGGSPYGGVIHDSAGNLYGTTWSGGNKTSPCPVDGCGVVYRLDPAGQETTLYTFSGPDGSNPGAAVALDAAGNVYGTTGNGGIGGGTCAFGCGTVFEVNSAGQETVLYNFAGGADGGYPASGVAMDPAGNLYGTAEVDGAGNCGVIFKVPAAGGFTVAYSFTGESDGCSPVSAPVFDSAGNLYGTSAESDSTGGAVYRLNTGGEFKVLYSFADAAGGRNPDGGVIFDPAGNLYGTTSRGGNTSGGGVVFKLTLQ
jgi:uncharacterized repeat protein (TIGR03803 family)